MPALVSVTMVLFLLGLLGMLVINANRFTDRLKENVLLTIYFSNAAPDDRLAGITENINSMEFVRSSVFTSKEQAAEEYKKEIQSDFEETIGGNPLPASLDIYVKSEYSDTSGIRKIKNDLEGMDFVQDVEYQADLVNSINKYKERISLVLLGITLILVIISIILITNTVRLSVFANRFLIKSMQLVGATEWFIVRPFVKRAFWVGTFGAIAAGCFLLLAFFTGANWVDKELFDRSQSVTDRLISDQILTHWRYLLQDISQYSILFVSLLILGIAILVLSTYVSTKKYLKLKIDDLY